MASQDDCASSGEHKMLRCASCGKSENEQGKLKTCTACKSVKYCNIDCQRNHRKVHKKECKRIEQELKVASRADVAAGLEALSISGEDAKVVESETNPGDDHQRTYHDDEDLFNPPPREECPLCLITLPIRNDEITYKSCCGKTICNGCYWKHRQVLSQINLERALDDPPKPPLELSCAFCRKHNPTNDSEAIERLDRRMALDDPEAFEMMSSHYRFGKYGLARDNRKAFELRLRAAELGSASACFNVSVMYGEGVGVERDASKEAYYLKLAAKKGHILARHNLGCIEWNRGNYEAVAVKHMLISAAAGHDESLKNISIAYRKKYATKNQYETAIRANKDAKEEMESEERDKAKAARASSGLMYR